MLPAKSFRSLLLGKMIMLTTLRRDWLGISGLANCVVTLALLISTPLIVAQGSDESVVAQSIEAFRRAVITKDRTQLEALCADQFSYGHGDGRVETKLVFIDDALGSRTVWKSIDFTNQSIQIVGNSAIVRHVFIGENERTAKVNVVKNGILMVWQKQEGHWKLLVRQSYRL